MDNLFLLLVLASLIAFIVALIKPSSFQKIFKDKATRKNLSLYFIGATIIFFVLFGITTDPVEQTTEVNTPTQTNQKEVVQQTPPTDNQPAEESESQINNTVINFDKLREWNPNDDSQAIGLEILVSKDDVTEESIINLVKSITSNTQKSVVKIYQNRQAWEEEQSGNYTDVYNQDYLAVYVKNLSDSGAYRGFNEIRWMQEEGDLQDLFGTKTKLN